MSYFDMSVSSSASLSLSDSLSLLVLAGCQFIKARSFSKASACCLLVNYNGCVDCCLASFSNSKTKILGYMQ